MNNKTAKKLRKWSVLMGKRYRETKRRWHDLEHNGKAFFMRKIETFIEKAPK